VALRENKVIELEDKKINYEKLSMERKITAEMMGSMFLKESEALAALIQKELDKTLSTPNRGVKQAGFYVLSGASMPCVLIAGGFVSNPSEEKNLKSPAYRKKIVEAIYKAIVKFKSSREKLLVEE
jgi:N-acetylmuramoyl-L-alanine amidase